MFYVGKLKICYSKKIRESAINNESKLVNKRYLGFFKTNGIKFNTITPIPAIRFIDVIIILSLKFLLIFPLKVLFKINEELFI